MGLVAVPSPGRRRQRQADHLGVDARHAGGKVHAQLVEGAMQGAAGLQGGAVRVFGSVTLGPGAGQCGYVMFDVCNFFLPWSSLV